MKLKPFLLLGLLIGGIALGLFWYGNLRGMGPAILPPPRSITKFSPTLQSTNSTGFPLTLPSDYSISIFAKDLESPRVLRFDPQGVLLASIPSQGRVVALPDRNADGVADETVSVIEGLKRPHGVAFREGKLYIAETDQVAVYDYDGRTLKASSKKKIIDVPGGGNHVTRTIGFGPDGRLYISIGSSCNVCIEEDSRRAKILVASVETSGSDLKDLQGQTPRLFASGLRNAVFFTWHPVTGEMWATEMGRDLIGDDIPPDEINIVKEGRFYGWPYCYGKNVRDATFDDKGSGLSGFQGLTPREICERAEPSHIDLPAHVAPLGLAFIPDPREVVKRDAIAHKITTYRQWSQDYGGDLLVAYHGSWNRSVPIGYKIVRMKLDEKGNYEGTEDFISGWLPPAGGSDGALGRPVDLVFDPSGNLYISDDKAGVIYRVVTQK